MPFAQVHYPFENRDWFLGRPAGEDGATATEEAHFPGDFIVEYIGQTRGWFYTLHVLATALFDKPAFKTCVAHGIDPESNHTSRTSGMRRIVARPVGSSGLGRVNSSM
ncbi:class I tRNA ligase family protein [Mycolicibacterium elephantis]|uniref:class I tRNA ligase family protein n=1 Tax=Mycolicibacterium elephantis TaxID=81858 RepID=UPI0039B74118